MTPDEAAQRLREADPTFQDWMPHQQAVFEQWEREGMERILVFYPTGTGKTSIMLTLVAMAGYEDVVVLAPPITHNKWVAQGKVLGIKVIAISHAKFRMADFRLLRDRPVIVDEFHLLGGQTGKGWKKLDTASRGLRAPLILGSATPNYNDAERCYCLVHVLDPALNGGGYIGWIYRNCETEENHHGAIPNVVKFLKYDTAAEFLADQPHVAYLPDEAPDIVVDHKVPYDPLPDEFYDLGIDRSRKRIMASMMETKLRESLLKILLPDEMYLADGTVEALSILDESLAEAPRLIFAQRTTVAMAVARAYHELHQQAQVDGDVDLVQYSSWGYIDGSMTTAKKNSVCEAFIRGDFRVLIGTASLATGPDGMDKMCDTLIIVDDTEDNSLRRQLVGRILPRGVVDPADYLKKTAYRFVYTND